MLRGLSVPLVKILAKKFANICRKWRAVAEVRWSFA
jgi:hypothetical protein